MAIAIGRTALIVQGVRLLAELLAAQGAPEVAARVMGFVLQQPDLIGAEREEAEAQMRGWGAEPTNAEWSGPPLDDLAHRIVSESDLAYAPLIAALNGGR